MHNRENSLRILMLLVLLCVTSIVEAGQSFIVSDIRIEGLEKIPEGTLLNYLPVIQGDPLDERQAIFAIKELYKTGFFADVQLFRDGDVLVIRVRERPSIAEITFDGNSDIDDETLEDAMKGVGLARGPIGPGCAPFQRWPEISERIRSASARASRACSPGTCTGRPVWIAETKS